MHNQVSGLKRMIWKRENIHWAAACVDEKRLVEVKGQNGYNGMWNAVGSHLFVAQYLRSHLLLDFFTDHNLKLFMENFPIRVFFS